MLYPQRGKVNKGNIVLRHSILHFLPNSEFVLSGGTQRRVLSRHYSEENGNIKLNFIFLSGN